MGNEHEHIKAAVPAAAILPYLGGLAFPCSKEEIVRLTVRQNAPGAVVAALEGLPEERYSSFADIMRHFGHI